MSTDLGIENGPDTAGASRNFLSARGRIVRALLITIVAQLIFGAACSPQKPENPVGLNVTDELGRRISVKPSPERIISLAPSVTETLFAIGLEDKVVGVTTYCDYPPEALQKEKIGDTMRPSIERIVALKPDLVIASTSSQLEQFVKKLDELGIPLYISNPRDLRGAIESITRIGQITGAIDRAQILVSALNDRVQSIDRRLQGRERVQVLLMLGSEPLITAGRSSFLNDLITRAGGSSISGDEASDYPQFSIETVIARKPEVIFLQSGEQELPQRLKLTPAARDGRIYHLDDELLLRPGPRITQGLEQMARKIHPEAFADQSSATGNGIEKVPGHTATLRLQGSMREMISGAEITTRGAL